MAPLESCTEGRGVQCHSSFLDALRGIDAWVGYLHLGRVLFPCLEYCRSTCGLYAIRKLHMQTYIMHTCIFLQAGAIECMCMALKQFPKKKDSVLSLCAPVYFFHAGSCNSTEPPSVSWSTSSSFLCAFHTNYFPPSSLHTRATYGVQAIAHAIRLHEKNQRLFVKHKGVDFVMAIMSKWEEDHDFYFLMLRTLRVRVL
jgi:hypothetical protein